MPGERSILLYRSVYAVKLLAITWFISKLICYKLWLTGRMFPLIPVHASLSDIPPIVQDSLFYISMTGLLLSLFFSRWKIIAACFLLVVITELLSCLLDQNRWQPWEYQFIFMALALLFCRDEKQLKTSWLIIIAGLYCYSAASKFNAGFIHDTWKYLVLNRWLGMHHSGAWLNRLGYLLPLVELLGGLGMLFNRFRKPAIWLLLSMHAIILLMLGPLGLNINAVVWPWNFLMPSLLLLLFYRYEFLPRQEFYRKPFTWLLIICWWILPAFQFAGYWDKYLSSVLYSGGLEQLFICVDKMEGKEKLQPYMNTDFKVIPCNNVLSVYNWAIGDMNTAPYPEPRIYKAIIEQWKAHYPNENSHFYLYKPGFKYSVTAIK